MFLKVKPFQETLNAGYCGPASLVIIFNYYGLKTSEHKLAKLCGTKKDLGTSEKDLMRVAKSLGFNAKIQNNGGFLDIEKWLSKGVPVIVDWFTRGGESHFGAVADGHYSVVFGLDKKFIYIQDPEIGRSRKITRKDFKKVWFDYSGIFPEKNKFTVRQLIAVFPRDF